jgi:vitamin B12 transporter
MKRQHEAARLRPDPRNNPGSARRRLGLAVGCVLTTQATFAQNFLEEVVVTSSRVPTTLRETGTSVSVLLQEEMEQRGFLTLPDMLRTQPSVAVSNNGGAGKVTSLRIRGEEGYRTMVLLDGVDIADTSSPQVSPRLEQLLTAGLERVEILRGPQGLHYGADAGGVINIRSETPDRGLDGRLAAEAGRYGTQQLAGAIGGDFGAVDLMVNVASFETDGFNARDLDTNLRDSDGYENQTVHARTGWNVNEALRLEAVVRRVEGKNDFDSCFNNAFLPSNACRDAFSQDSERLAAELELGAFTHQLAWTDTRTQRDSFADDVSSFTAEGALERVSYVGRWSGLAASSVVYGFDRETESIDDGTFDRDRDQLGVFAEYQGRLSDALTVTAGARWDDNDDFGDFTTYRLSAAHVADLGGSDLKVKATYGTGFRAPSLFEISYNNGPFALPPAADADLREEQSEGYDIGLTWARDDGAWVEVVWFDQRVDQLIVFDLIGFSGYVQDDGESSSRGIEVAARWPVTTHLVVSGNYTWNETEAADGGQRAFRPEHLANLGISHLSRNDQLRLGLNLRASRDAVDTDGSAVDNVLLLDANASYRLNSGLQLYVRAENLLDDEYQEVPTYNSARRAAYTGIRYEF